MNKGLGFGTYRIQRGNEDHEKALRKALINGVSIIDTSSNYTNGESEAIIGEVITELSEKGAIKLSDIQIVSKGGYIQGHVWEDMQARQGKDNAYQEAIILEEGLAHSMHPTFLEEQLTASLNRLQQTSIDTYLIHNPEYYFTWANKQGMENIKEEFYRRIQCAFEHLEKEVKNGRIKRYGISSNSFPLSETDPTFVSLQKCLDIAKNVSNHHAFEVVQLPCNLIETGGVTENNNQDMSVIDFAKENGLEVLINRPLNAISHGKITRLADQEPSEPVAAIEVDDTIQDLQQYELTWEYSDLDKRLENHPHKDLVKDVFKIGTELNEQWSQFQGLDHWQHIMNAYIFPRVEQAISVVGEGDDLNQTQREWLEEYLARLNDVTRIITLYFKTQAQMISEDIKMEIAKKVPDWAEARTLSQIAIRALRSIDGVTAVLVGMRSEDYVVDIAEEYFRTPPKPTKNSDWEKLALESL